MARDRIEYDYFPLFKMLSSTMKHFSGIQIDDVCSSEDLSLEFKPEVIDAKIYYSFRIYRSFAFKIPYAQNALTISLRIFSFNKYYQIPCDRVADRFV